MAVPVKTGLLPPEIHARMIMCAIVYADVVETLWKARTAYAIGDYSIAEERLKFVYSELPNVESHCQLDLARVKDAMKSLIDKIHTMSDPEVQEAILDIQTDLSLHLSAAHYQAEGLGYTGYLPRLKEETR
jgi:hypothetical protein